MLSQEYTVEPLITPPKGLVKWPLCTGDRYTNRVAVIAGSTVFSYYGCSLNLS